MFVMTESFRRNPKLHFNDKRLPKGNKTERLVSQFLELSVNPKGNLAYKLFFDMTEEKKQFVVHAPDGRTAVIDDNIDNILNHVFTICTMDKDEIILKRLHTMFIASVKDREVLAHGELEEIIMIYESLSYFYKHVAKNVRELNYLRQFTP